MLVAATLVLASAGCGATEGGPLQIDGAGAARARVTQPVGGQSMLGAVRIGNGGEAPLTVVRVRLTGLPAGLRVVGTYLSAPGGRPSPRAIASWPAYGTFEPGSFAQATSYVLAPSEAEDYQPLVIVQATEPGLHRTGDLVIDYRVGDRRYERRVRTSYAVCAVAPGAAARCG